MRHARIYQPTKTTMQSGKAGNKAWKLDFIPIDSRYIEPVMGWTANADMLASQLKLTFSSKEDAIAYAQRENISYEIEEPKTSPLKLQNYSSNFKHQE